MPCVYTKMGGYTTWLSHSGEYKPGDPPPTGYNDWHEWAAVQHKAGLRQQQCGKCGLWRFPQEMSEEFSKWVARTRAGQPVQVIAPVCKECHV